MPDTEFRYYDYEHVDASAKRGAFELEKHGVDGAFQAYKNLRPYAYRSDLWRYMALWDHGGIYLDAKVLLNAPLSTWVDQDNDGFACCNDLWEMRRFDEALSDFVPQQALWN